MKKAAEDAGITTPVHLHGLRHAMANWLVNRRVPLGHVRKAFGHESIGATRIYAETETESGKESFDSMMGMGD